MDNITANAMIAATFADENAGNEIELSRLDETVSGCLSLAL